MVWDASYACCEDIAALETRADNPVTVFAPPPPEKQDAKPEPLAARQRKRDKSRGPQTWRTRMAAGEAETVLRRRGRIERINAHAKRRGLDHMLMRGMQKVQSVAVLHAIAHNLATAWRIRTTAAAAA